MVPAFLVQETEGSSAGSPPIAPWDNSLNRAINTLKKKDKLSKPSSAGRVSGKGCSTKWSNYYSTRRKEKSTSGSEAQLQEKMEQIPCIVEEQVGHALNNMTPSLFVFMRDWLASGQEGLPPIPSFMGSNYHNAMVVAAAPLVSPAVDAFVTPAAARTVPPAAAATVTPMTDAFVTPAAAQVLERKIPTPGTSGASAPSVTCPPAVGGPSTLAELNAITVTKPRPMTSSPFAFDWASLTPYMFSQDTVNVPCTLLHFVDEELVDVAVGRIVQPGIRVFHGNP